MKLISRGSLLTALLLLGPAFAPARAATTSLPLSFQGTWYIALDNHFYRVDPGTLSVDTGTFTLAATTSLNNCARSNGLPQLLGGNLLAYSGGVRTVYLDPAATSFGLSLTANGPVLTLASASGDIVCDGQTVPGAILADGFE